MALLNVQREKMKEIAPKLLVLSALIMSLRVKMVSALTNQNGVMVTLIALTAVMRRIVMRGHHVQTQSLHALMVTVSLSTKNVMVYLTVLKVKMKGIVLSVMALVLLILHDVSRANFDVMMGNAYLNSTTVTQLRIALTEVMKSHADVVQHMNSLVLIGHALIQGGDVTEFLTAETGPMRLAAIAEPQNSDVAQENASLMFTVVMAMLNAQTEVMNTDALNIRHQQLLLLVGVLMASLLVAQMDSVYPSLLYVMGAQIAVTCPMNLIVLEPLV